MNKQKFVDLDNARIEDQVKVMEKIISNNHCPFCEENLEKYHKRPILRKTNFWIVTTNQWPYDNTKNHFLLIYRNHLEDLGEINLEAGRELFELTKWLKKKYKIPGGALCMRFGDTNYSAGSVTHIHAQLIVPEVESTGYLPVRFKIGKG